MNFGFSFKSYLSRYGVEVSLLLLLGLGVFSFFKPQFFTVEKKEIPVSQEAVATLGKIKMAVEKADIAEKAFLARRNEDDLNMYNEQVLFLNHHMGQLLRVVSSDPVRYRQVTQLNKALKRAFRLGEFRYDPKKRVAWAPSGEFLGDPDD